MKNITISQIVKDSGKSYLEIPDQILKDIGALETSKVFLCEIDGILQVSTTEPYIGISILTLDKKKFVPMRKE